MDGCGTHPYIALVQTLAQSKPEEGLYSFGGYQVYESSYWENDQYKSATFKPIESDTFFIHGLSKEAWRMDNKEYHHLFFPKELKATSFSFN